MNTYKWLVRREFWENRAIWILPASIGALLTFAALVGRGEIRVLAAAGQNPTKAALILLFVYAAIFWVAMAIYASWYLLDSLYADRRDRSVLFWKSLPISDTATVLSKLFVGLIAIPAVYFVAADVSTLLMTLILSAKMSTIGGVLWQPNLWLQQQVFWVYVILSCAIWNLPIAGWLMLVSAWSKRAVILWAILPPLAAALAERIFIGTHVVGRLLSYRLLGYGAVAFNHPAHWPTAADAMTTSVWQLPNPLGFASNPDTWIGALVGAGLIAAAVQMRLRRAD
jgi:ABC-2 type transport system permease protein